MRFLVRLAAFALGGAALHCGASPVSHGVTVPAAGRGMP